MIKALLVEDEPIAVEILSNFIKNLEEIELVAVKNDANSAMKWIYDNDVDVIFQDINLPQGNGIDLIKSLPNPPAIVFTTAYPEHAVDGFELNAIDYLVKPIAFERFKAAVEKVKSRLNSKATDKLSFKANNRTYLIDRNDIIYFQSAGDYVKVNTADLKIVVNTTMKHLESLKQPFLRVHKSFIINTQYVDFLEGNLVKLAGESIPIGASYKLSVLDHFK
ncbi:MAG: LytTR family DNA-binding domain-containing protein [Fulvivirga sp.]